MKPWLLFVVLAVGTIHAAEEAAPTMPSEVTLTTGRVLRNVQVIRWEPNRVVLKHSGGADPIAFNLITEPLRSRLGAIRAGQAKSANTPAVTSAASREINGQVFFIAGGNSRAPKIAGVEVRLYRASDFEAFDRSRTFPVGHERVPDSQSGLGFGDTSPNVQGLLDYMETEFKSWDGLPEPLAKTTSDLDGRFVLKAPAAEGGLIVFARHRSLSSYERGGSRRFAYVWSAPANSEGATILGNDQLHPGMKKALNVFFR